MADRTWKEVRDAVLAAIRIASRLSDAAQSVNWYEDPVRYSPPVRATLTITNTGSEGQRQVTEEKPSVDPPETAGQFTDLEVGVSRIATIVVSVRVEAIKNDRALDAMNAAERIRAWMYPGASPAIGDVLRETGVVYVQDLAMTPVPEFSVDSRICKVWVLDLEFRAELYFASTERVGTIARVSIAGELDTTPITHVDLDVPS